MGLVADPEVVGQLPHQQMELVVPELPVKVIMAEAGQPMALLTMLLAEVAVLVLVRLVVMLLVPVEVLEE
jgi:hypothetical protein